MSRSIFDNISSKDPIVFVFVVVVVVVVGGRGFGKKAEQLRPWEIKKKNGRPLYLGRP